MSAKRTIKSVLLAFVLVSIGFALGKEYTLRSLGGRRADVDAAGDKVIVYYLHGAVRCVTCNKIEKMAHEIVQRDFAAELQSGRLEWRSANFQTDEALAQKYNIFSSTVLLVRLSGGKETQSAKLSDVWIHVDEPAAFNEYIKGELAKFLGTRS